MSYLAGVLARATEELRVVRPRPKARFEDGLLLQVGTTGLEDETSARPASRSQDVPGTWAPPPIPPGEPPRDPATGEGEPAKRPQGEPGPMRVVERVERVLERAAPEPPPRREPEGRAAPIPAVETRAPVLPGATPPLPPASPPAPPVPAMASAGPLALERRPESVLATVRETVERERVIERRSEAVAPARGEPAREPGARPVIEAAVHQSLPPSGPPDGPRAAAPADAVVPASVPAPAAPHQTLAPPAEPEPEPRPSVHISIGQVEIRAAAPRAAAPGRARRVAEPSVTLDAYLRGRQGGGA